MAYREQETGEVFGLVRQYLANGSTVEHSSDQTAGDKAFTAVAATNICTAATHGLVTGQIVHVTNSGGALPAGLSAATDYYINKIDADTFYLCSSYAYAVLGTSVDITGAGTGTHTVHAPVLATYSPAAGNITRVKTLTMLYTDGTGGIDNEFGNLGAALTYGIRLYKRRSGAIAHEFTGGLDGTNYNTIKTNADMYLYAPDYKLTWKTVAGGNDIVSAVVDFEDLFGQPVRLVGDTSDALVAWMDDDLSGLTTVYFIVAGYQELGAVSG